MTTKRISRKERRQQRQERVSNENSQQNIFEKLHFDLKFIEPLTKNQEITFDSWKSGKNLLLVGTAGTGKSFLSAYMGMNCILQQQDYEKMLIVRSVVPTRDMGFLPGSNREKSKVYEAPYYSIFSEIFGRGDAYDFLKNKNLVEFVTTSFVRGITVNNSVVFIDELQNMTASEINSVFTRIGKKCRVIIAGDVKQNDLNPRKEESGFGDFFKVIRNMNSFNTIEFTSKDIVRGDIVKEYLLERERLEELGEIQPL
jgi:phosphate starvation-inducible protein PhoH